MYEQFFGLDEEPFRLTADPRFFYLSPKHAEALAHLRLGLTESSGFVCITGEVGTGKTTLLRAFLAELGPNVSAAYTFVPPLSAIELLKRICAEFGITPRGSGQSDLLDALQTYLVAQHAAGRVCVVVLDEAQALSIELLEQVRLLLNFETPTEKLLRIVLVGQPQLRKLLMNPELAQLNQRITLRWHLGPLSYRQTVAYVKHRVQIASNGRATSLFTTPALWLLHSVSGGVPRLINMVAHRALLTACVEKQARIHRRSVAHAYREIQTVPLPGTLSFAYRAGVAAAGLAVGGALMMAGIPRLGWLGSTPMAASPVAQVAVASVATVEEPSRAAPVSAVEPIENPVSASPVAAAPVPVEPVAAPAPAAPVSAPPAAPVSVALPRLSGVDLVVRLTALEGGTARASTTRMLEAWSAAPLSPEEQGQLTDLETVAWRRGLQVLSFTGNRGMLRLLNLPVQLTVKVPGSEAPRFVTLVAMEGNDMVLDVDGVVSRVDATEMESLWSGQARLMWRDVGGLGPALSRGARGTAVMRLQNMLRQAGVFDGDANGIFDPATENAVVAFQRAHQLVPDGVVGAFTRIVLYGLADDRERPTLALAGSNLS